MGRPWIKIESDTPNKPEVCIIATKLKLDPDMVIGKLVRLWAWAEQNIDKSNTVPVTREFLDRLVGQRGFASAMEKAGWLDGEDGEIVFPNFSRHNGKLARVRAQTAERVSRHRARKRVEDDGLDTDFVTSNASRLKSERASKEKRPPVKDVKNIVETVTDSTDSTESTAAVPAETTVPAPVMPPPAPAIAVPSEFNDTSVAEGVAVNELTAPAHEPIAPDLDESGASLEEGTSPAKGNRRKREPSGDQPLLF